MNNKPIGIFDSGIGGLTVLKEYLKLLPNENYIYYADTANLPYGNKTQEEIIEYSKRIVEYFINKNVKAIIIACGTASSLAYTYLKENYNIPIFNIITPIAQNIKEKNIGIIATPGSINSHAWENEIIKYNPDIKIIATACQNLVPLAEKGIISSLQARDEIKNYLKIFKNKNIEALILGCTHYPIFSSLIQKELGNNVKLINVGTHSAIQFKNYLIQNNLINSVRNIGKVIYIVNGDRDAFIKNAFICLGYEIEK